LKVQVGSDGSRRASAGKGRSHVTARPSYRMSLPLQVQPPVPRGERKRGGAQRLPGRRITPREGLHHSFRDGQWRHKQGGALLRLPERAKAGQPLLHSFSFTNFFAFYILRLWPQGNICRRTAVACSPAYSVAQPAISSWSRGRFVCTLTARGLHRGGRHSL
jgi:hypothetical protein